MNQSPKVFFRTNHNYGVNNKDNKYIVYYGTDKKGKTHYKKCKDKMEYKKELIKYICGEKGFFKYSRNEDKANISMFDYYTGAKKCESTMEANKMKREEMMMMSNGEFASDLDSEKMQKTWSRYLENSNVHQMVLSFNNDYINENIEITKLQKEITTKVMPLFLKKCGYKDPNKNIDWVVSLHCDTDNLHFHIGFVEKRKSYSNFKNKITYKNRLNFTEDENNFFKRQTALVVEREKLYTPALMQINKDLDEFKNHFNPKEKNFILKNYKDINLEEKILKLGYLLNKVRSEDRKYIKYNSLPKNDEGIEIRRLTKEIKKELFKDKELLNDKKQINKSIDNLNEIFKKIDIDNNISNTGFESAMDNKLIKSKLEKNDNYVLNAIVNHAIYKTRQQSNDIKNGNITFNDLLNEIALGNYKKELNNHTTIKIIRIKLLRNSFNNNYVNKDNISKALKKIDYNTSKVQQQFEEIFGDEKGKAILER